MKNTLQKHIVLFFSCRLWSLPGIRAGIRGGLSFLFLLFLPVIANSQLLKVSDDGHRLLHKDGTLFFYMADTGWELLHRLTLDETETYLKDRKAKGFNVIQTVILAENDGLRVPNAEGELPLFDMDPAKPNEKYFEHVDKVVRMAEKYGLFVALLPTWGDKFNLKWGVGPVIFTNPDTARMYGEYIGERYKDFPNIIWVLGGDRQPENDSQMKVIQAMAEGLNSKDGDKHLITYHMGGSSGNLFHNDEWLDFNMEATGHAIKDNPIYKETSVDYNKKPAKPCLNGEACYEDLPVGFNPANGRFYDYDVRQAGYWTVLAGGAGYAYGNNNIWQMIDSTLKGFYPTQPWYDAIKSRGATQMGYLRKLFESRPFIDMVPDQDVLAKVFGQNKNMIRAARGKNGSFAIIYTPSGNPVHVDLKKLEADTINGYWYNPREGTSSPVEEFANTKKVKAFVPPSSGPMVDWVLILDDKSKNYSDPAKTVLK